MGINPFAPIDPPNTISQPSSSSHCSHQTIKNPNYLEQHKVKLNFPQFNGEDPNGWLYRAEQYFEYMGIPLEEQVSLASFHLKGIALQWHRWITKFRGPLS